MLFMDVHKPIQRKILSILSEIGTSGATITEIEKRISFERHTLSKYLSFMEGHGLIYHKDIGKAKVWFINKAPIQTVLYSLPAKKTFAEKILSDLIAVIPFGLIIIDKDYTILFQNKKMITLYGKKEGEKFYTAILGLENPLKIQPITHLIDHKTDGAEALIQDKEANTLNIKASRLVNPDGSESFILIIEDVTKQKNAEKVLDKSEEKYRVLTQTSPDCIKLLDTKGIIAFMNEGGLREHNFTRPEQAVGLEWTAFFIPKHQAKARNAFRKALAGETSKIDIKHTRTGSRREWCQITLSPITNHNKEVVNILAVSSDITERKKEKLKTKKLIHI